MTDFDPYSTMLGALREAETMRYRIVNWTLNREAFYILVADEFTLREYRTKPLLDAEFMGIPLNLDTEDFSKEPHMRPPYEMYGKRMLIHDYEGPILHGNDLARFHARTQIDIEDAKRHREAKKEKAG